MIDDMYANCLFLVCDDVQCEVKPESSNIMKVITDRHLSDVPINSFSLGEFLQPVQRELRQFIYTETSYEQYAWTTGKVHTV